MPSKVTGMPVVKAAAKPLMVGAELPTLPHPLKTNVLVVLSFLGLPSASTFWIVMEIGEPAVVWLAPVI